MKVLGVDPGLSGAVVTLRWPSGVLEVRRDFTELRHISDAIKELAPGCDYGVIELVAARPGQGVTSMFSFGRSTGTAMGAMYSAGLDFIEVTPQRWQAYWTQLACDSGEPFDSAVVATKVFGVDQAHFFRRKKDHNTADAALLAAFAAAEIFAHGFIGTSRQKNARTVGGPGVLRKKE